MKSAILWSIEASAIVFTLAIGVAPGFACGAGKIIFEDKFQTLDQSWGIASDDKSFFVDAGTVVLRPDASYLKWPLSQSDYYGDVNVCAEINIVDTPSPDQTLAGVLFWAADYDNMYLFNVSSLGTFSVQRRTHGKWLTPIHWTATSSIKQGTNQWNELEIQTRGNQATFLINKTQLGQINGSAPDGGGLVGVVAESPEQGPATVRIRGFKVLLPAGLKPASQ